MSAEDIGIPIESIEEMWSEDLKIDESKLTDEWIVIYKHQTKYRKMYTREHLRLIRMQSLADVLHAEKYEHYVQGGSKETFSKGWTLPPVGKILKNEVERYLKADKELIDSNLKVAYQREKVEFLKDIVNMLTQRQWILNGIQKSLDYFAGGRIA